ncbi:MAG: thiamine phosphate synthase [Pseudomonadales bacterium]|nr:thiamine phosphate synthase [Pseudomonadales bacterium]
MSDMPQQFTQAMPATSAMPAKVWSIAGSDNSCGAGIQADNKVFDRFAVQAGNLVTALTAQNQQGVSAVALTALNDLEQQWQTLLAMGDADVIKLGMLGDAAIVDWLQSKLAQLPNPVVVCDPVLFASAGGTLMQAAESYLTLAQYVSLMTPNQQEFAEIFAIQFDSWQALEAHAKNIAAVYQLDLVITGGDSVFSESSIAENVAAIDLCVIDGEVFYLHSDYQAVSATHGTGCAFASALAASLALGYSAKEAVVLAKTYLNQGFADLQSKLQPNFVHTTFPSQLAALPSVMLDAPAQQTIQPINKPADRFAEIDQPLGLYPVVDSIDWLTRCLQAGVKTIQLRIKHDGSDDFYPRIEPLIAEAVRLGDTFKAQLFINDHWQLALKYSAYGVHLGQEDLDSASTESIKAAGIKLGVSTHSWFEIARAHSLQPSYIAIGPIYATTTKVMPWVPQGLDKLARWCQLLGQRYPTVAIGGINLSNASEVLSTGVGSIAMVRAITEAPDYQQVIVQLEQMIVAASKIQGADLD